MKDTLSRDDMNPSAFSKYSECAQKELLAAAKCKPGKPKRISAVTYNEVVGQASDSWIMVPSPKGLVQVALSINAEGMHIAYRF